MQVNAVVSEVLKMREAGPGAKAVVFSTWSRLLKVTSLALQRSRVPHVSLAAAQEERALSLKTFQTDPDCSVLLVVLSTLGEYSFPTPPQQTITSTISRTRLISRAFDVVWGGSGWSSTLHQDLHMRLEAVLVHAGHVSCPV